MSLQIDNLTRHISRVPNGRVADNFFSRFKGLMGAAVGTEVGDGWR
jgi:hypothetical protein